VATFEGRLLKINFKMKRVRVQEDKDCWFCFDNASIDRELIVDSSFTHFYIALPKGPVTDEHFLIVPKKHIAHSLELTEAQETEFNSIKTKLLAYLDSRKMDYLVFERNTPFKFSKAAHMNVQIIGLQTVNL
jgi:diadenosine tetraphosphate (Ap4A) HIT family hydrolase